MAQELAPSGVPNFALIFDTTKSSQISTYKREIGVAETAKIIFVLLEDLNNYFNVSRPMTIAQMTDLSIEFVTELWTYKMEDFLAFFEAMKKNTLGQKIYERLDPPVIWEQLERYEAIRGNYLFNEANKFKQSDPRIYDEQDEKAYTGLTGLSGMISGIKANINQMKGREKNEQ